MMWLTCLCEICDIQNIKESGIRYLHRCIWHNALSEAEGLTIESTTDVVRLCRWRILMIGSLNDGEAWIFCPPCTHSFFLGGPYVKLNKSRMDKAFVHYNRADNFIWRFTSL